MQWVRFLYEECRAENARKDIPMPPFDEFWETGYVLFPDGPNWVRHVQTP
ncbi:trimethylamine-N-oxide reductase TorA [Oligella ureolytica]